MVETSGIAIYDVILLSSLLIIWDIIFEVKTNKVGYKIRFQIAIYYINAI